MGWLEIFCLVITVVYSVFLLGNIFTFYTLKKSAVPSSYVPQLGITVIIAARNEEGSILQCLDGIAGQDFPQEKTEVIVVNDHSLDKTAEVAEAFLKSHFKNYRLIQLTGTDKGKKTAINRGIEASTFGIIVTCDADTYNHGRNWLRSISYNFERNNCDILLSPVLIYCDNSFTAAFQALENLAINFLGQAMARKGLPIVCSGANLAYKKECYLTLQPYKNNLEIASGDDMFLLKAAYKSGMNVSPNLLEGSIIYTYFEAGGRSITQRLRWASKSLKIATTPILFTGLCLLSANLAGLYALALLFIDSRYLPFCLFTLIIKLLIDFLLLLLSSTMFGKKLNLVWFLPAFVFNLIYTPVISMLSVLVPTSWKGRKV